MRKTLGTIFIVIFASIIVVDGILNADAYRADYGSEILKNLAVYLGFLLWIWMLIDLFAKITYTNHIQRPWLWVAIVVMTYVVGAFVYYLVIYLPKLGVSSQKQASDTASLSKPPKH